MKPFIAALLSTAVAIAAVVLALSSFSSRAFGDSGRRADAARIERGRYLVHGVGLCIDCHSPRNEKGEFLPGQHLMGAPIGFTPSVPMPWMPAAPKLAGLPQGFTAEATVHFLMTGERPNGRPPALPPMPAYRMDRADAEAVTAYLQSLKPAR